MKPSLPNIVINSRTLLRHGEVAYRGIRRCGIGVIGSYGWLVWSGIIACDTPVRCRYNLLAGFEWRIVFWRYKKAKTICLIVDWGFAS